MLTFIWKKITSNMILSYFWHLLLQLYMLLSAKYNI